MIIAPPIPPPSPLTATAADAIEAMIQRRMGAAAVVDEHGIVAGFFTERDVMTTRRSLLAAIRTRFPSSMS